MSISKIIISSGYDNIQGVAVAKSPGIGRATRLDTRTQYGITDGSFNPTGKVYTQDASLSGFAGQFSVAALSNGGTTIFSAASNGFGAGSLELRNNSTTGVYVYLNRDVAGTTGYFVPANSTYSADGVLVNKINVAGSGGIASPIFLSALPNIDPSKIL